MIGHPALFDDLASILSEGATNCSAADACSLLKDCLVQHTVLSYLLGTIYYFVSRKAAAAAVPLDGCHMQATEVLEAAYAIADSHRHHIVTSVHYGSAIHSLSPDAFDHVLSSVSDNVRARLVSEGYFARLTEDHDASSQQRLAASIADFRFSGDQAVRLMEHYLASPYFPYCADDYDRLLATDEIRRVRPEVAAAFRAHSHYDRKLAEWFVV
jgi:hypothetical protein